ncbi:MAG: hypothetical protein K1X57_08550 [Gemmataceae bacterium]|nr:hypothetical protein [Gemmataceae bacterium]
MKFPLGAMTLGDVLDRALKLMLGRLPLFLGINALMWSPLLVFNLILPFMLRGIGGAAEAAGVIGALLLLLFCGIFLVPLANAASLTVAINEYLDRPTDFNSAIQTGFRHLPSLIGTAFLTSLITTVGYLMCLAPGLYFAATYFITSQIVVAESKAMMPAMSRSSQLVTGHRWRALGLFIIVSIITQVLSMIVVLPLAKFLPAQEVVMTDRGFNVLHHPLNAALQNIMTFPIQVVFGAYMSICATLFYLDLRIRKEGLDLQIAAEQMKAEGGGS